MIHFDPQAHPTLPNTSAPTPDVETGGAAKPAFLNAIEAAGKYVSKVNDLQQASDASIQDLLTGKNNDITAVVAAVAKADVSFKVLVGVRNKLIEAYKQTMNMPL
jgi:flagellar hook-basal body complex protein FliE